MKIGLMIITMIHDITQAHYAVKFEKDFNGMMRLEFFKDGVSDFYEHTHCGIPGGSREKLEKDIIQALNWFKNEFSIPDAEQPDDDLPPAA